MIPLITIVLVAYLTYLVRIGLRITTSYAAQIQRIGAFNTCCEFCGCNQDELGRCSINISPVAVIVAITCRLVILLHLEIVGTQCSSSTMLLATEVEGTRNLDP